MQNEAAENTTPEQELTDYLATRDHLRMKTLETVCLYFQMLITLKNAPNVATLYGGPDSMFPNYRDLPDWRPAEEFSSAVEQLYRNIVAFRGWASRGYHEARVAEAYGRAPERPSSFFEPHNTALHTGAVDDLLDALWDAGNSTWNEKTLPERLADAGYPEGLRAALLASVYPVENRNWPLYRALTSIGLPGKNASDVLEEAIWRAYERGRPIKPDLLAKAGKMPKQESREGAEALNAIILPLARSAA